MDYFDLAKQFKGGLVEAFKGQKTKFLIISFSSDWLYTTKENKDIVIALNASGADVSYSEIITDKGHDSFLLDVPVFLKTIKSKNELNNIPIIALSAHAMEEHKKRALEAGCNDYDTKPVDIERLLNKINKQLGL